MIDLASIAPQEVPTLTMELGADPGRFAAMRAAVKEGLARRGFALLRGTGVADAASFASAVAALGIETEDRYGDLPHEGESPGVFRTTEYPPSESIFFHSEASHMARAPRLITFACIEPAAVGGTTPLSDNARALAALPRDIVHMLEIEGLRYERTFIPGLDVSWETFFGTNDRSLAAERATAEGLAFYRDSDGVPRAIACRRAILVQRGGLFCLFQQIALHHPAFLDSDLRADLAQVCGSVMPRNVALGSGAPLPDSWAIAIHDAQCRAALAFTWEPGDVLVVDNVRMSHARAPFEGPRRHLVMLSRLSPYPERSETNR
jgi:hypothetical protein